MPIENVFATLQIYLGSAYVNDLTLFGRNYRVTAQADSPWRLAPEDISRLRTRNADGEMVPLGSLVAIRPASGPDRVVRHNLYPTAEVQMATLPGRSSGQTLAAAETLVKDGFKVMVYCADDPIQAKRLEEIGCVAVMPLASLIGSGMGILNPWNLRLIIDNAKVPVLVDAGVGTASDAAIAMELGCDGVLMNTAIAGAQNPVLMASAMKKAVEAGREAYRAGRMPRKLYSATPSSPTGGLIGRA